MVARISECGFRIAGSAFRNPHSAIRNGLRAKPALSPVEGGADPPHRRGAQPSAIPKARKSFARLATLTASRGAQIVYPYCTGLAGMIPAVRNAATSREKGVRWAVRLSMYVCRSNTHWQTPTLPASRMAELRTALRF